MKFSICLVAIFAAIGSLAQQSKMTYFCNLRQNGSEIFLKIIETKSKNGNTVSAAAELLIGGQPMKLVPNVKKKSGSIPSFPYRSIEKWTAIEFVLIAYVDSSFPGRTLPVDLVLLGQPKIKGVCEF